MLEVVCGYILKDNKVLLCRRLKGHLAGKWEFPGGKLEFGETDSEALMREIDEELGIELNIKTLMIENFHDYGDKQINLRMYYCEYLSGEIELVDHSEYKWVEKKDILNYDLAPADREIAENI